MKIHRRLAALSIALAAPMISECSNGVGKDSSAPSMRSMDSAGMAMTASSVPPDDEVSFANDIQPIFDLRCTNCHNPILLRGGMDLTEGNSYAMLVNVPTSAACRQEVPDSVRVATCETPPCDPSQSMLWAKAKPDAPPPNGRRCRQPMPFGTPGLGEVCGWDFHFIEQWIIAGAPNN
jgi:hypothetical protein